MALVDDKHEPLLSNPLYRLSWDERTRHDVRHLLQRGDDKSVVQIGAVELAHQHLCVLGVLYGVILSGKAPVFIQRLNTQFDTVHQEHHLFSVIAVRNELSRFETGHRLA